MRLYLFEIFGFKIPSYGVMICIGLISAFLITMKIGKKHGMDEDDLYGLFIQTVIFGVLGGKLLWIITEFKSVIEEPMSIITEFGYGFVIYGAIIGGTLGILLYAKKLKWSFFDITDLAAPAVAVAQGFGRIGCFLAGCCHGKATHSSFGVLFPSNSLAPSTMRLYPTQIASSIFDFILGVFLIWYTSKNPKKGKTTGLYFIIYSIGRFIVEFFRGDERGNVGFLSTSQFIAIFILIGGLVVFFYDKIKNKKNAESKNED
ncbi:Prolipoprotein diacylglyceryl transferase [Hathewaya proteolytica DSM 3090]|uniref:Phosphatidylglycerol--prolipoprotein diacylglyceryl transferase n=1 Tax=Hathewaya proteolytica DSM 3090 TaxID=1121331 RepID=A0A1M6RLF5_9CLOT|nr:prolipoprotein diacylglyceryl transferase [Hathewaya proteolytica]SHK33293.1 Prolipoprotein diacylglyceryl transferase [Hathewaya proteolytica DSM 3090]